MVAIVYARVSTEDQARKGYSLPDQLEACRQRAEALGATKIIECIDEGVTGSVLARPGLEKARALVRAGGVSLFVALDPDRLARNLSHQLLVTEELDRAGVRLEFVNFEWKNTPEGRLFYSLRGAIAEFEKEKIRERSMRGKRQKARQGLLTHDPGTYGYDYSAGQFTVNSHKAAIVRQIFDSYLKLGSFYGVADRLNEMGTPSPKGTTWSKVTVRRILQNETYTGTLYLNKHDATGVKANRYLPPEQKRSRSFRPEEEWIPVKVPVIIDEKQFQAVQELMKKARRFRPGNSKTFYLLSGIIQCGICGKTMHGNLTSNAKGKKYRYYVCTAKSPGVEGYEKCSNPHHHADEVEAAVLDTVNEWLTQPQIWQRALEANMKTQPLNDRTPVEKELKELVTQRERLLDLVQKGLVDTGDISGRLEKLREREEKLKRTLSQISSREGATDKKIGLRQLKSIASDILNQLSHDRESQKVALRRILDRVVVEPERITLYPNVRVQ